MVNLQKEFIDFHDEIKLSDENEILREKRDILLTKLRKNISEDLPSYTSFNQGSYAMGTGIKPEDGDYDIDVGLKFSIDKDDYSDPVDPKIWVRDALKNHTKSVTVRRSCVTVTYQKDDEPEYHVDFAVYANANKDEKMYISKGKEYSDEDHRYWELSDPQQLISLVKGKFDGEDAKQFRRVIRYLKKWKDHNSMLDGNGAPTGISLTILAYDFFAVAKEYDSFNCRYEYNDFAALKSLVESIRGKFVLKYGGSDIGYYHQISAALPVEPKNNLFEKMTARQMETLYEEICSMFDELKKVEDQTKKSAACEILANLFGEEFPIAADRSYVGTSESA